MKDKVIEYYKNNLHKLKDKDHIKHIKQFITYLSNAIINDESAISRFATYTKTYDKIRNQNFKQSCPKEYDLFKEYF